MDELHLTVSLRSFIAERGFTTRMDLDALDVLQQETWWAVPSAITGDPLAATVRLGVFGWYGGSPAQVRLDAQGTLLRRNDLLPQAFERFSGLKALRSAAATQFDRDCAKAELMGWIHEPVLLPRVLLLIYRVALEPDDSGAWVPVTEAALSISNPIDSLVLPGLQSRAH